jgi:hypothetical protein
MTVLEGQEGLDKQYQSNPDKHRLAAFNTYQEVTDIKLKELGGVATHINSAVSDRGDRGGYWQFPDEKSFFDAYDWMATRSLLPQCLAECTACGAKLPLVDFGKGNRPNGRSCQCKPCSKKRKRTAATEDTSNPSSKNGTRRDAITRLSIAIEEFTPLIEELQRRIQEDQVLLDSYLAAREGLAYQRQQLQQAEGV